MIKWRDSLEECKGNSRKYDISIFEEHKILITFITKKIIRTNAEYNIIKLMQKTKISHFYYFKIMRMDIYINTKNNYYVYKWI